MEKNYEKIDLWAYDIDAFVTQLQQYAKDGRLVCADFNGHTLYSDTVTIDSAYIEICDCTKAEYDEKQRKWREDYKRKEQEHKSKIPELSKEWIEKGHKILSSDKWEYWDKIVPIRLGDLYRGMELGNCLEIIEFLNKDDFDGAKNAMMNQGHSGMSWGLVKTMVKEFSDKGGKFAEMIEKE